MNTGFRRLSRSTFLFLMLFCLFSARQSADAGIVADFWTSNIPAGTRFTKGNGSPSSPYLIETPEQLALLARKVNENDRHYANGHYRVTKNIDLSAHGWFPIGHDNVRYLQLISTTARPFRGTFDGGDHTISGITCKKSMQVHIGFFGFMENATVRNVVLEDVLIDGTDEAFTAGALTGKLLNSRLENCRASGKVLITRNIESTDNIKEIQSLGGLAGRNFGGTLIACVSDVEINAAGAEAYFLNTGGIVGANSDGLIEHCVNNAVVRGGQARHNYTGGIAGFNDGGTISDSINKGKIAGDNTAFRFSRSSVGGMAGENGGIISGCSNEGVICASWSEDASNTGGIAGWNIGKIEKCLNHAAVGEWIDREGEKYISSPETARTGGIVGWNSGRAILEDCINVGKITDDGLRSFYPAPSKKSAAEKISYSGGIAGTNAPGARLVRCHVYAPLPTSAPVDFGAIAGQNDGKLESCYWLRERATSVRAVGIGNDTGTRALDKNAFASADSFEELDSSAWFRPLFDPSRPRLKAFYFVENGGSPRIGLYPEGLEFIYGSPDIRNVTFFSGGGRIEVANVTLPPETGLEVFSREPNEIKFRYDGKGKSNGRAAIAYKFYLKDDGTEFREFTTTLPVTILNALPGPSISASMYALAFVGTVAAFLLAGKVLQKRRAEQQETENEECDIYP